jgi:hypothetical protein
MPVLHMRILKENDNINLSRSLHAQSFVFKRAVVVMNPSTTAQTIQNLDGGLTIQLSFFTGFELLSNLSANNIYLPFSPPKLDSNVTANTGNYDIFDIRYSLQFDAEDVKNSFNAKVYHYDSGSEQPTFGTTAGTIKYIDLYFEFDNLFNTNNYQ